ncbi:MAG: PIN domain-containing protein [Gemmatimonadaceae bacterium]|nr:PIN domain-containing protein [Gemmatimonadaceae bacterium]
MPRKRVRESPPIAVPRLLVDTNVLLDVILARTPWAEDGALLLDATVHGTATGYVAGHAITTLYYVVEQERGRATAMTAVNNLLEILSVVPLGTKDFQRAAALGLRDFEDAVHVAACLQVGADFLVTRNERDFKGAPIRVRSPGEILAWLPRK